jgi:hypothetical protein
LPLIYNSPNLTRRGAETPRTQKKIRCKEVLSEKGDCHLCVTSGKIQDLCRNHLVQEPNKSIYIVKYKGGFMKKTLLLIFILYALVLFGCINPNNNSEESMDKVIVTINLPQYERSSFIDDLISKTTHYDLVVKKDNAIIYNAIFSSDSGKIVLTNLSTGEHLFLLSALIIDGGGGGGGKFNLVLKNFLV